jgi:adenylate cyclase
MAIAGERPAGGVVLCLLSDEEPGGDAGARFVGGRPSAGSFRELGRARSDGTTRQAVVRSRARDNARVTDTVTTTFMFADIAGFTALTEAHGDEEAADLVSRFCDAVEQELAAAQGRRVKTIGDAVMLAVPDPGSAVQLGLRITTELIIGHGAPAVRVGLHHGSAVHRFGDYFGAAVNLAARVSAEAAGNEVLLTAATAALAPTLTGVVYEPRGRRELRNVRDAVELCAAIRSESTTDAGLPCDPVCRMAVDPTRAAGRLVYGGATYFFCTLACAGRFAQAPERYVRAAS